MSERVVPQREFDGNSWKVILVSTRNNMDDSSGDEELPTAKEELVGNAATQRNWRGIAIALLVIVIVCSLIITAVVLLTPSTDDTNPGEKFTLDDFFDPAFKPKTFSAKWIAGEDKFFYRNEEGALSEFDCPTNTSTVLMDNTTFRQLDTDKYTVSPDKQYVLLKHDVVPIFRHTTKAQYTVYDVNTRAQHTLSGPFGDMYQYVAWGPRGHALLLIQQNNIYYMEDLEMDPEPLTVDGHPGYVFNGIPDWVYEEEILASDHAVWWSSEGNFLCFIAFNDSQVPTYSFPMYGDMHNAYGGSRSIAYPKAGFDNPTVKVKIIRMSDKKEVTLKPPSEFQDKEHYVTTVTWKDDQSVLISWVNRPQNFSIVTLCEAATGNCDVSLREEGHGGWVDFSTTPLFSLDGTRYFWVLPQKDGNAGYFKHVAMIEFRTGKEEDILLFLMMNKWEVFRLEAYNNEERLVYFLSNGGDPRKKHLYSVGINKVVECLTCDYDERCEFISTSFSSTSNYFILQCLGPGVPYYSVIMTDTMEEVARMENNTALGERLAKKALPKSKDIFIELDNKEKVWGKMLLPPKMKPDEITQYPLILNVYGGPGTQKVTDQFAIGWETYLTSSKDFIYAYVDGRGSGGRGQKFLHKLYRRLGTVEVEDALTAGKYFSKKPYVNSEKMGIWGWSYGGFLTLSALGSGKDVFPCGVAVAPVTDWRYYDSVYTERYMGTPRPDDNQRAYDNANISAKAEKFKTSKFLLVHGTGDDNVHFQHSAQFIKALTEANVYFRLQIYTDKHHGLLGGNTRRHLYETMEDFLDECFDGRSPKFGKPPDDEEDDTENSR